MGISVNMTNKEKNLFFFTVMAYIVYVQTPYGVMQLLFKIDKYRWLSLLFFISLNAVYWLKTVDKERFYSENMLEKYEMCWGEGSNNNQGQGNKGG